MGAAGRHLSFSFVLRAPKSPAAILLLLLLLILPPPLANPSACADNKGSGSEQL
jgi:hypothetical protein